MRASGLTTPIVLVALLRRHFPVAGDVDVAAWPLVGFKLVPHPTGLIPVKFPASPLTLIVFGRGGCTPPPITGDFLPCPLTVRITITDSWSSFFTLLDRVSAVDPGAEFETSGEDVDGVEVV